MAPTRADTQKLERVPHGGGEGDSARARPGEPQTSAEQACSLEDELDQQVRCHVVMDGMDSRQNAAMMRDAF